jgi:hypothetical protein
VGEVSVRPPPAGRRARRGLALATAAFVVWRES